MHDMSEALGLESGRVRVVPYDGRWESLFRAAAADLRGALGDSILAVEHVGSTSVPGLAAKPILDLLVAVPDFGRAVDGFASLAAFGYEHRPDEEIPDRHYFRRLVGGRRTHHLSLAEPGSDFHRRTILFRDALRSDPELAGESGL